jgi:hypothetical protein
MPGFVKTASDEKKWSRAKKAAGKKGDETNWALSNYIFHRMKKCVVDPELVKSGDYKRVDFVNRPQLGERHITTPTGTVVRKEGTVHGDKVVDIWFSPEDVDKRTNRQRTAVPYIYPPNNLGSPRDNQETDKPFEDEGSPGGKGVWINFKKGMVKISSNLLQAANAAWGEEDGEEGERRNNDVGNEVKDAQRLQKIDPPKHIKQDLRKRPVSRDQLYPSDVAGSDSITWGSFKIASKDGGDIGLTDSKKKKIILRRKIEEGEFVNQNQIQGGVKFFGKSPTTSDPPDNPAFKGPEVWDKKPGLKEDWMADLKRQLEEAKKKKVVDNKEASDRPNPIKGGIGDDLEYDEVNKEQLKEGIDVEQEHVKRDKTRTWEEKKKFAADIAMDHLEEDPEYYTKLKKLEDKPYEKGIRFVNKNGNQVILKSFRGDRS